MKKLLLGMLIVTLPLTVVAETTNKPLPNCDAPEIVLLLKNSAIEYSSMNLSPDARYGKSVSDFAKMMNEYMSFELVNTKEVDYDASVNKSMKQCITDAYMFFKKNPKTENDIVPNIKYQIFMDTKEQLKLHIYEVNNRKVSI